MNKEIFMVLKMVEEGKLSADKAKKLIDALGHTSKYTETIVPKKYKDKFLKVEVLSHEGDKVNVQLLIKVVKEVLKVTGKLPISTYIEGMDGADIDYLMNV